MYNRININNLVYYYVYMGNTIKNILNYKNNNTNNNNINMPSYKIDNWLEFMSPDYLKIKDITKMDPGQKETFLCIDRNFYDFIYLNEIGKIYTPGEFFIHNYIIEYTHKYGLHGNIQWINDDKIEPFNFDINYYKNYWYPLDKNGYLPSKDPQGFVSLEIQRAKYWEDFPNDTLIGWRGPMINWKYILNSPNIYIPNDS